MAAQIGAVNTLVRQADGSLKGYNTDYSAAIGAIEAAMVSRLGGDAEGALKGKTVGSDIIVPARNIVHHVYNSHPSFTFSVIP